MLRTLDLFSGIGGFSLGLERTGGFETVAFCEIDQYCRKVLRKHWPDVPIHEDVRELTDEVLADTKIRSGRDIEASQSEEHQEKRKQPIGRRGGISGATTTIDLICGGYPCQPFSLAGKRGGAEDDRHLWPEVVRLVASIQPRWCLFENVAGHISMGLDDVLSDLEGEGYTCWPVVIPACAVDAPHRRDRVWIVANSGERRRGEQGEGKDQQPGRAEIERGSETVGTYPDVSNADNAGRQQQRWPESVGTEQSAAQCGGRWLPEPGMGRVASRLSEKLDGSRLNGNEMDGEEKGAAGDAVTGRADLFGMRLSDEIAEASSRLQQAGPIRDIVWPLSLEGGSAGRTPAPETETDMRGLRNDVSAQRQSQPQDMQRSVPIGDRPAQREQAMAWEPEPADVPRVAVGIPNRVNRLKGLGNAVVPQVVEMIGRAILEADDA